MQRCFLALLLIISVGACSSLTPNLYKLDVRQGNVLEPELLAQVQAGMSKRQVQNLLGTPLLTDPFNQNRWDYVFAYYPRGNRNKGEEQHITLYFEGDILAQIQGADTVLAELESVPDNNSTPAAYFPFTQPPSPELGNPGELEQSQ